MSASTDRSGRDNSWSKRFAALRNVPPVLRLIWDAAPAVVAAGIALRLVSAFIPLGILEVTKWILHVLLAKHGPTFPPELWWLLGAEFALAASNLVLGRAIDYTDARLADEFTREISLRLIRHATRLDLALFEDPGFHDVLERARQQATDRIGMLNAMGRLLLQSITLVTLSIPVIAYSPLLFLILLICIIPAVMGESHFAFLGYALAHAITPIRRELDYIRVIGTSKENAKEVKLFGLGDHLHSRYDALTGQIIRKNIDLTRHRLLWGSIFAVIGSVGYYASYLYLVWQTFEGRMDVPTLVLLAGAIAGSSTQLQGVFSLFSHIADQALHLTDLVEFLKVQPSIRSRPNALPAPRPIRTGFEFRNVTFQYPGTSRTVLKNLNFHLEPGEHVALVGENGQGKTTLVKLLARLYDPSGGAIYLDGIDLREYSIEELHKEIGVIFQDFVRYDMPARTNIGVGRVESMGNDEALWIAAEKSRADRLLARFSAGLDQMLGRRFEGGVDLSGGEWQKFALARAYLRDAQVLILDEPTAALDAVAEAEVFARFDDLSRGKMALLISHRFSTVRKSDRIVVLEGGQIYEEGTHDQLVAHGGRYASLFELQAASYR
ncbi:MAG TPA: ABC transporter ATP-binding protein [Bryobacteraceae bacterium]|nr:ABC transporter ATP-binding protein [Bryobacteraceae bacterium]